jgi:hypothetical protein
MGVISLIVEGSTVGTVAEGRGVVIRRSVSEADSARLIKAYAHSYAENFVDENGKPRPPSIEEVLGAWFDGIVGGSVARVLSVERELAAQGARDAVKPIEVGA